MAKSEGNPRQRGRPDRPVTPGPRKRVAESGTARIESARAVPSVSDIAGAVFMDDIPGASVKVYQLAVTLRRIKGGEPIDMSEHMDPRIAGKVLPRDLGGGTILTALMSAIAQEDQQQGQAATQGIQETIRSEEMRSLRDSAPPTVESLNRTARRTSEIVLTFLGNEIFEGPIQNPMLSRENLTASQTKLQDVEAFVHSATRRVLDNYIDEAFVGDILHPMSTLEEDKPVAPALSSIPLGMHRVATALALQKEMLASEPAVEYVAAKTIVNAALLQFLETSEGKDAIHDLNHRFELMKDLNTSNEATRAKIQKELIRLPELTDPRAKRLEKMAFRLILFTFVNDLGTQLPLLDDLALIPLLDPALQEQAIATILPGTPKLPMPEDISPEPVITASPDTSEQLTESGKVKQTPTLTLQQQDRLFFHMRANHTKQELFRDDKFRADMEETDMRLWERAYDTSENIADILIACNRGLLVRQVKAQMRSPLAFGIPYQVMHDSAVLGLMNAMQRFDPEHTVDGKKLRFMTYAEHYARFAMQETIIKENGLTRRQFDHLNIAARIRYAFFRANGRELVETELPEQLLHNTVFNESMIDFVIGFNETHKVLSLQRKISKGQTVKNEGEATLEEVTSEESTPAGRDKAERVIQQDALSDSFAGLTRDQEMLVRDGYGLNPEEEALTPEELSIKYEKSVAQITQELAQAIVILSQRNELSGVARGRKKKVEEEDQKPEASLQGQPDEAIAPDEAEYRRALRDKGMSRKERVKILSTRMIQADIGRALGVSGEYVRQIQNRLIADGDLSPDNITRKVSAVTQKRDQIIALYRQGLTYAAIAQDLQLDRSSLDKAIANLISLGTLKRRNTPRLIRLQMAPPPSEEVTKVALWLDAYEPNAGFWKAVKKFQQTSEYASVVAGWPPGHNAHVELTVYEAPKNEKTKKFGPKAAAALEDVLSREPDTFVTQKELIEKYHISPVTAGRVLHEAQRRGRVIVRQGIGTQIVREGTEIVSPQIAKDAARQFIANARKGDIITIATVRQATGVDGYTARKLLEEGTANGRLIVQHSVGHIVVKDPIQNEQ